MHKWVSLLGIGLLVLGMFAVYSWEAEPAPSGTVPAQVISPRQSAYLDAPLPADTVLLEVTINPQGEMDDVRVLRDYPGEAQEALRQIEDWKFRPAMIDGKPIRSSIPVVVRVG